ncbi:MAG TPA: NAD-binding protein [Solirubrobacterales bacterium]|nr:NAD-binding protein [Solirubrobacterales bacterium]
MSSEEQLPARVETVALIGAGSTMGKGIGANLAFRLALAAKDAGLALAAAEEEGLELPMLAAIRERMDAVAAEHGDEDLAAVYLASSDSA